MNLSRFIEAQDRVYERALAELKAGEKRSHWMWFIFPQVAGLGRSPMAQHYAIHSLEEARAYLADPMLGPRYRECCEAVLAVEGKTAHDIFGSPDDLKFHSSLTLFGEAAKNEKLLRQLLEKYCGGEPDRRTLELLR